MMTPADSVVGGFPFGNARCAGVDSKSRLSKPIGSERGFDYRKAISSVTCDCCLRTERRFVGRMSIVMPCGGSGGLGQLICFPLRQAYKMFSTGVIEHSLEIVSVFPQLAVLA
jgi:hypothetical protein